MCHFPQNEAIYDERGFHNHKPDTALYLKLKFRFKLERRVVQYIKGDILVIYMDLLTEMR
jgi:hypothetical protein